MGGNFGLLSIIKLSICSLVFSNVRLPAIQQTLASAVVLHFLPLATHQTKHYGIFW